MKRLMFLICSFFVLLFSGKSQCLAQNTTLKAGIYVFTDSFASEFYGFVPTVMTDFHLWSRSQLDLRISPGFSYRPIQYNDHYHNLFMVPLLTTLYYELPNPESEIHPTFGIGGSLMFKADQNKDYDKTHYAFGYGFHATGRLNLESEKGRLYVFDLTYNLMMPPFTEEVNVSGVVLTVGMSLSKKHYTGENLQ
jgi:hypothetical protein